MCASAYVVIIVLTAILFSSGVALFLVSIYFGKQEKAFGSIAVLAGLGFSLVISTLGCYGVVITTIDYNDSYAKECNIYSNNENTIYENTDNFIVKKYSKQDMFSYEHYYEVKMLNNKSECFEIKPIFKGLTTIFYIEDYQEPTLIERKAHKGGNTYELYVPLDTIWVGSFENE